VLNAYDDYVVFSVPRCAATLFDICKIELFLAYSVYLISLLVDETLKLVYKDLGVVQVILL